jgi:hypothetical protein
MWRTSAGDTHSCNFRDHPLAEHTKINQNDRVPTDEDGRYGLAAARKNADMGRLS